jgi:hypothetical protein
MLPAGVTHSRFVTVMLNDWGFVTTVPVDTVSVALTVNEVVEFIVTYCGVPEITPVIGLSVSPAGSTVFGCSSYVIVPPKVGVASSVIVRG